ncbi:MAG: bifunctional oligoribonuclease/PAP phosphatase NrnA [Parasporobacterium sp.]|nr:bifunctional oligoribonuclease/PAP phosphatase NrnA [Parasporobacterium sp.]
MPNLKDFLTNVNSVCISGHIHPDGDCVGSTLGLYTYLRKNFPEIETNLYLEEPTEKLKFLNGFDEIISDYPDHAPYDIMFCLDSASFDRIGRAKKYFEEAKRTVNVDHHISNTLFAEENFVDGSSSSASEEIYKMMDPSLLDHDTAVALYTGIVYDTGVFKYSCTSPLTMSIVGELMKHDIPAEEIIDDSFYAKTFEENRIFGYAIVKSALAHDGKMIYSTISKKEMKEFNVSSKELDGIVSQLRLTKGVLTAAFLYETPSGDIKLSLRSSGPFDVNRIAVRFGGGGHIHASGALMKGNLEECVETIVEAVGKELEEQLH